MRYRLNFKGFTDTREMLFGPAITEAISDVDFSAIEDLLIECVANIKSKLGVIINLNSIENIQFTNQDGIAGQLLITGQDRYILLVNPNVINSKDELISTIYHELCHAYQLNRLFTEKLMAYDYLVNDIVAINAEAVSILKTHLNVNGGHTQYWQELVDKINSTIQPAKKITAYLSESIEVIHAELLEEEHFKLDFDGFYDTRKTLFGEDE
jgi:hypothetical protein